MTVINYLVLTINYLAQTLWHYPMYGLVIAPFVVLCRDVASMVKDIEFYEGTLIWKETKTVKSIPQGYYMRVAPRSEWLRSYVPSTCDGSTCHSTCTRCADLKHCNA